jgi:peptidoglycan-N-acetylglucosamine deacetylase
MNMNGKPLGTLQVDVDELWVYYESIGRSTPLDAPSLVYEQGIPRLLDLFDRYAIRATFFVCGRDLPAQAGALREMIARGHEVANHSATHRNGFARLTPEQKRADIAATGAAIAHATGVAPVGFKSPGFSFSSDLFNVLADLGYLYDSSLLPTFYAPLLRLLQGLLSGGHVDPTHYGRPSNGLAPLTPYQIAPLRNPQSAIRNLQSFWEAPVTTTPILRLPMHSTFVLSAGRWLFDFGFGLARTRNTPINYLLHAADVVDAVSDPALDSYKFLTQSWEIKRPLYEHMLATLSTAYRLAPTVELVGQIARQSQKERP